MVFINLARIYCSQLLLCTSKGGKKLNYRAVLSLPIDLRKIWIAKNIMISMNLFIACVVLLIGINLVGVFFSGAHNIPVLNAVMATIIMVITSLWQIPLCLFLSKSLELLELY